MNIFVLDADPRQAARYLCDKHVVKMVLESAQMLSTVARHYGSTENRLYKPAHPKHKCTLWAMESKDNCLWLWEHADEIGKEFTRRYGGEHTSSSVVRLCETVPMMCPDKGLTPFALAMPDQYKTEDPVLSYRKYYINEKVLFASWRTEEPRWWRSV